MSWTCRIHGLNLEHVTLPRLQVRDLGEMEGWAGVSTEDSEARPSLQPWPWGAGSHSRVELSRVQAAPEWGQARSALLSRVPVCGGSLHGDYLPRPWLLEFCPLNSSPASQQENPVPSCAPSLLHPSPQREAWDHL